MKRRMAAAVLALAGLFVSLYLWLHKIGVIGTLQCGTGGCEVVQTSPHAMLLGLPVALYGVAGYLALFGVALLGLQPAFAERRSTTVVLAVLAALGFAFTIYLKYVELFVIGAVCWWCMSSAALITAILLVAVADLRRRRAG